MNYNLKLVEFAYGIPEFHRFLFDVYMGTYAMRMQLSSSFSVIVKPFLPFFIINKTANLLHTPLKITFLCFVKLL